MSGAQDTTQTPTPAATETPATTNPTANVLYPEGQTPSGTNTPPPVDKPTEPVKPNAEGAKPQDATQKGDDLKEIVLPDGSLLSQDHLKAVGEFAKQNGLTNKQAQEILNAENDRLSAFVKTHVEAYEAKIAGYEDAVKSDKEIGGANFNKSMSLAKRTLERFGSDALKTELDQSGFGSHPEVVRLLAKIGAQMSDDTIVGVNAPPASQAKSAAEVFYGSNKK